LSSLPYPRLRGCIAIGRHGTREAEAGGGVEVAEFGFRALAAAGADEHVDVVRGGTAAFVRLLDARGIDAFNDQQPRFGVPRTTARTRIFAGASPKQSLLALWWSFDRLPPREPVAMVSLRSAASSSVTTEYKGPRLQK
jgi:hypothetical protein